MGKYFLKDTYKENTDNLYYDDNLTDNTIWQPDVYNYAVEYAKKHGIKNIIDIGSGNGDKLYKFKNDFNITFIDFGANLDIIKSKFSSSKGGHNYIDQDFEKSFPTLPPKIIKNSVVVCSDVIEHIRNMDNLSSALVDYSKTARLLMVSTPDRERLYGFDQNGNPTNPFHVREWKMSELELYFSSVGMRFLIGLTRTNDRTNQRSTLCVMSGRDIMNKDSTNKISKFDPNFLIKVISKNDLLELFKERKITPPNFDDKFCGLYNPYAGNYMVNRFIDAVGSGATYSINKFKFIDQQTYYNTVGSTNIDSAIVQFIDSATGEYPIAFTFFYEGDTLSHKNEDRHMTLSAQHLAVHYLPEVLLGFSLMDREAETLAKLPNIVNMHNELTSHMGIKRSAKLLSGNIKRKISKK